MNGKCILCGKNLPEKALFTLMRAPASAQQIPAREELAEDTGVSLALTQCAGCGLCQFDAEPVSYYRDVIRAGGLSTTMTGLRRAQYAHFIETCGLTGKRILEAGCGRGEFLKVLTEFPVLACGIEHSAKLCAMARADGLTVWEDFPETADHVIRAPGEDGPFDAFLSFNFLEHQPDPRAMLLSLRKSLTEDGVGLVTVPALEYIVEKGSYYELIHDHIAYYTFSSLENLFRLTGFTVLERDIVNRDTIAMIVKKAPLPDQSREETALSESGDDARLVTALTAGYRITQEEIANLGKELAASGRTLAVWGASHQGFTLLSTTPLWEFTSAVIDSAPFKQGRFAPSSHVPIISPDGFFADPADTVLITAPGYTEEIADIIKKRSGGTIEVLSIRSSRIEHL